MYRIATLTLAALVLTGCAGGSDEPEPTPTVTVTAEPEPAPTVTVTAKPVEIVPAVCLQALTAADEARAAAEPAMQSGSDLASLVQKAYQAGRVDAMTGGEEGINLIAEEAKRISEVMVAGSETHTAATENYLALAADCQSAS